MRRKPSGRRGKRRGAVVVLVAVMMILFVSMIAFAVDYGYILTMETDLQRAADAAALAAVQDLIPNADGSQNLDGTRATLRTYVQDNLDDGFQVADADIDIGRFDTSTIYTNVTLLNSGVFDAVRVTLRRDGVVNDRFPLFFAQILGARDAAVTATATAVLQKPQMPAPGAAVLPFAVPVEEWMERTEVNETWTIYGDGRMVDEYGDSVPGNWGTLDIGSSANSTADISDQIRDGLHQSHLDHLYDEGRITTNKWIDLRASPTGDGPTWMNADPGLSVGLKHAVQDVHGLDRVIPLYDQVNDSGGNVLEYRVVAWGVATVADSRFAGTNRYVKITKSYMFSGRLRPVSDLTIDSIIEGAYTSPVLVE